MPGQDHFRRHESIQADLPRLEYNPHAAAADFFQQFVVAEVAKSGSRWRSVGDIVDLGHLSKDLMNHIGIVGKPEDVSATCSGHIALRSLHGQAGLVGVI